MKAEQLAIHSLSTSHRNLQEALDAYAAAGFRHVEPYLPLVKAWIEDGHTMEQTRDLFDSYGLRFIASSELAVECFHASDVLLPNLRANAENARLIGELGGSVMIVHTDGPEQVTAGSLDPIARALLDLADATEHVGLDVAVVFGSEDSISVGQNSLSQPRSVEPDTPSPSKGPYRDFIERFGESLRQETIAFIEVMKGERENPSLPDGAMEALRVAVACEVSRKEGRPVRVAEIEDEPSDLS